MIQANRNRGTWAKLGNVLRLHSGAAVLTVFFSLAGCTTSWKQVINGEPPETAEHFDRSKILFTEGDYQGALRENQRVLADGKGSADVALFNMGLISTYSLNPKRDYPSALHFFRTLVKDHPNSPLIEQSKVWIYVLEQRQKIAEAQLKLAKEKRTLTRERAMLSQEREKLKYMIEKSRQVDIEIEKRRRRTLMK